MKNKTKQKIPEKLFTFSSLVAGDESVDEYKKPLLFGVLIGVGTLS